MLRTTCLADGWCVTGGTGCRSCSSESATTTTRHLARVRMSGWNRSTYDMVSPRKRAAARRSEDGDGSCHSNYLGRMRDMHDPSSQPRTCPTSSRCAFRLHAVELGREQIQYETCRPARARSKQRLNSHLPRPWPCGTGAFWRGRLHHSYQARSTRAVIHVIHDWINRIQASADQNLRCRKERFERLPCSCPGCLRRSEVRGSNDAGARACLHVPLLVQATLCCLSPLLFSTSH